MNERALVFARGHDRLIGIVSHATSPSPVGVLIIVGGPQYRSGSHRQYVLLARALAGHGYTTMRFDSRGMGDSTGPSPDFEHMDEDIRAAIDALVDACPELRSVVLWGLCDAASAAMLYAPTDARVRGLALANPWARGEETYARTHLRHYYLQRLASPAFWLKLLTLRVGLRESVADLAGNAARARGRDQGPDYRVRMLDSLCAFRGAVLLIICGQDLTAREFLMFLDRHQDAKARLVDDSASRLDLPQSDHTFSQERWRLAVESATAKWLDGLANK